MTKMTKTHLQANKGEIREPMAMCATQMTGVGKVRNNSRRTYVSMRSEIVKLDAFKTTPAHNRCAHCCDIFLERRNIWRKKNGKAPVEHYNDGWEQ